MPSRGKARAEARSRFNGPKITQTHAAAERFAAMQQQEKRLRPFLGRSGEPPLQVCAISATSLFLA